MVEMESARTAEIRSGRSCSTQDWVTKTISSISRGGRNGLNAPRFFLFTARVFVKDEESYKHFRGVVLR